MFKKETMFLLVLKIIILLLLLILHNDGVEAQEQKCHEGLSVELPIDSVIINGSIIANGLTYRTGTYWNKNDTYFGCPCLVTRCLRRCLDRHKNAKSNGLLEFTSFTIWHNNQPQQINAHQHFYVFTGNACSNMAYMLEPDDYHILRNGTLLFRGTDYTAEANNYCVLPGVKENEIIVEICEDDDEIIMSPKTLQHYIYPVFMLISVVFLFATLIAYTLASEMRNVHGKSIACQSGSLMMGFLGLAITKIFSDEISDAACSTMALIIYYFMLATFFWMHVMCFDIWWTFSDLKKMTGSLQQASNKKFKIYSIYAWTMPTIFFTITLLMEFVFDIDKNLKPGFGNNKCWFQDEIPEVIYFNGPISIILGMNIFFFISTTLILIKLKKASAMLNNGDSKMHNVESENNQRFKLYMKLFLIMGLSWIMEIISAFIGGPEQIWYLTDSINCLQGVFIFICCVWTTKVKETVIRRIFPRFAHSVSIQSTKSNTRSSDTDDCNTTGTML